jgi:ankyrin repeat protein
MKRFWQCPNCWSILEKSNFELAKMLTQVTMVGTNTCPGCGSSQSKSDVYGGTFDFAESDDFIAQMAADHDNRSFDETRKRYVYKGRIVALLSDDVAGEIHEKIDNSHAFEEDEFYDATKEGDVVKVKALLKVNPGQVASKGGVGQTPLHLAAGAGHKEVVELLLVNKANINAKDIIDATPLHLAAFKGHKEVVEVLLAYGADVNAKTNDGHTPLHWAVYKDQEEVAELLRQHGGHE